MPIQVSHDGFYWTDLPPAGRPSDYRFARERPVEPCAECGGKIGHVPGCRTGANEAAALKQQEGQHSEAYLQNFIGQKLTAIRFGIWSGLEIVFENGATLEVTSNDEISLDRRTRQEAQLAARINAETA
jgi:hypothetical protein